MKKYGRSNLSKEIRDTVRYFANFDYPPDFTEIYTFLPGKTPRKAVKTSILNLARLDKLKKYKMGDGRDEFTEKGNHRRESTVKGSREFPSGDGQCTGAVLSPSTDREKAEGTTRYTLGEYSNEAVEKQMSGISNRLEISRKKLANWRLRLFLRVLGSLPCVELAGFSGSISMLNANSDDDVDLFIIAARNRLFTARFLALAAAQLLGIRRSYGDGGRGAGKRMRDKVCLNLLIDGRELSLPKEKRTVFVGHEVLQMKPVVCRNQAYERFLEANGWVFRLFPNAKPVFNIKYPVSGNKTRNTAYSLPDTIFNTVESFLKSLQMRSINRHRTTELITDTQLWFHPDDYGKKIGQA